MTPANITALQALVQADPALAQQLQSAGTNETATNLLVQAVTQNGSAVNLQAIADYLKISPTASMTDAELEAVAGGRGEWAEDRPSEITRSRGDDTIIDRTKKK